MAIKWVLGRHDQGGFNISQKISEKNIWLIPLNYGLDYRNKPMSEHQFLGIGFNHPSFHGLWHVVVAAVLIVQIQPTPVISSPLNTIESPTFGNSLDRALAFILPFPSPFCSQHPATTRAQTSVVSPGAPCASSIARWSCPSSEAWPNVKWGMGTDLWWIYDGFMPFIRGFIGWMGVTNK